MRIVTREELKKLSDKDRRLIRGSTRFLGRAVTFVEWYSERIMYVEVGDTWFSSDYLSLDAKLIRDIPKNVNKIRPKVILPVVKLDGFCEELVKEGKSYSLGWHSVTTKEMMRITRAVAKEQGYKLVKK